MIECNQIERKTIGNLDIVTVTSGDLKKYFITANSIKNGSEYSLFKDLLEFIQKENAHIISHLVFGSSSFARQGISQIVELSDDFSWPVTWLDGDACDCDCLTSTQVTAVSGVDVEPVMVSGERLGSYYQDEYAEYCYLGNVHADDLSGSNSEHARIAFEKMLSGLKSVGMDFSNAIRMWNYLDDLLNWYDDFNVMRTAFFNENDVFNNIVPAGTGIGAGNPYKAAYVGDLIGVKPKNDEISTFAVPSPLQCPAIDYKSSFSRAIEIDYPDYQYLSVSGTASIEPGGKSVYIDDTAAQIDLTMKVISAILESRGFKWSDTAKAIAYFKDIEEVGLFDKYLSENGITNLPVSISHADICRHDLLFELELDAVK